MNAGAILRKVICDQAETAMEKVAMAINLQKMCKEYAYFYKELANSEYIMEGQPKEVLGLDVRKSRVCELNVTPDGMKHQNRTFGIYFDVRKKGTMLTEEDHQAVENDNPEIIFIDGVPVKKDAFLFE